MKIEKYNDYFFIVDFDRVIASSCEDDMLYNIPKEYISKWEKELPIFVDIKRTLKHACTCYTEKAYSCPYSYWNNIDLGCSKTFSDGTAIRETIFSDDNNAVIIVRERYAEKIFNILDEQFPEMGEKIKVYIEDIEAWLDGEYVKDGYVNVFFIPGFPQKTKITKWKKKNI